MGQFLTFQGHLWGLLLLIDIMNPKTIALFFIAFTLSACTGRANQELDFQPQSPSSQSAQTEDIQLKQLSDSHSSWSLWGGYPLHPANIDTATLPSNSLSCESTNNFCIIPHRYYFQRPFSSPYNTAFDFSYLYGSSQFGALAPHHGVEILNPTGTPVLAVKNGTVIVAGNDAHSEYGPSENFYGNLVMLAHHLSDMEEPVYSLYGHLSTINVHVGQSVSGGETIGEVGTSGRAGGSHLHFEVRVGANHYANTRNPALWLFPRYDGNGQQYGVLVGKIGNVQGDPIHVTLKVEYYSDIDGSPDKIYYLETYARM